VDYFTEEEELYEELSNCRKKSQMLQVLGTNSFHFKQLIDHFGVDLNDIKRYAKKKKYKLEYGEYIKKIGYHPTTTEMRDNIKARNIWAKITRYWGSMSNFRKEYNYPVVKQGNPKFREDIREWTQKRSAAAILKKMGHMETILENLSGGKRLSKNQIAYKCNISEQNCLILLNRMIKKGDVVRVGGGSQTAYMLIRDEQEYKLK
jgi:predicted transcriptional regulator